MKNRNVTASPERLVVVMIVVVALLFIAAVSYAFSTKEQEKQLVSLDPTSLTSLDIPVPDSIRQEQKDTDGDGLFDWEEILWGTDIGNPDTDGDGIRDRDDSVSKESIQGGAELTERTIQEEGEEKLTISEKASRELFTEYMFSLQNGETITPEKQEQMAVHTLEKIAPLLTTKIYYSQDFETTSSSIENKKKYMDTIGKSLLTLVPVLENEPQILSLLAQDGQRGGAIEELKKLVEVVQKSVTVITTVQVPEDALVTHTRLTNAIQSYASGLENFTYFESDPIRSAVSIQTFDKVHTELKSALIDFQIYVIEKGHKE